MLCGGFMFCLACALPGLATAQQQGSTLSLQEQLSTLQNQVKDLQSSQQLILNRLDDLKKSMLAKSGAPPDVQPPATINIEGESFTGSKGARVAIIEYTDFECPFCGRYKHETYPEILKTYIDTGKVKYLYRDMPLPIHPDAILAARAARCAGEQGKLWQMRDSLFADQQHLTSKAISDRAQALGLNQDSFSQCLSAGRYQDLIQTNIAAAQQMHISGTPTFLLGVIEPGSNTLKVKQTIVGAYPFERFQSVIDELIAETTRPEISSGGIAAAR